MVMEVFFDGPEYYYDKFSFYSCGSSPRLLSQLLQYLDKHKNTLTEINICLYLFNNSLLNDALATLAQTGVVVNVYTIPIEGYDNEHAKEIIDIETGQTVNRGTKYSLAREVFAGHYREIYANYNLCFFPHMYVRSAKVNPFSRGGMPYSLHAKSFMFTHKNGAVDIALSSSNFAVRDLVKDENMLLIYNNPAYNTPVAHFFNTLQRLAINIRHFDFTKNYSGFTISPMLYALDENAGFIAPFYARSPTMVEDYIRSLLTTAKRRIIIVGQHVCPVEYDINLSFTTQVEDVTDKSGGLTQALIERANGGVAVEIISQTFAGRQENQSHRFRTPLNRTSFMEFFDRLKLIDNIQYYVNEHCHSKYIIIDDQVFVSTFNYTPTQFIYLDKVHIPLFVNSPGQSYKGVYAEVGQFLLVKEPGISDKYVENFKVIKASPDTVQVK